MMWRASILCLLAITVGAVIWIAKINESRPIARGGNELSAEDKEAIQSHFPLPVRFNGPEITNLKRRALLGEIPPGIKLMEYYGNCITQRRLLGDNGGRPNISECELENRHWMEITAQNGDPRVAEMLFSKLVDSDSCTDVYRARFWLGKALENPHPVTDAGLDVFESKKKSCRW